MKALFLFLGGLSTMAAVGTFLWAETAVHEIGAFILVLASVILFSTAMIVNALETLLDKAPQ